MTRSWQADAYGPPPKMPIDWKARAEKAEAEIARLTRTLIWIAHTYTEDSHGNMKTLPAADYQKAAKDALKPDTGEMP